MRDLMIDIETLSTDNNAVVLQIGAVQFDAATVRMGDTKVWDLDYTTDQVYRRIDPKTLDWWMRQDPAVVDRVLRRTGVLVVSGAVALGELGTWIAAADNVWARGPHFDCAILNDLWKDYGLPTDEYIPWYKWRDERPMRDLLESTGTKLPRGAKHNAAEDAAAQVRNVLAVYKSLQGKGATE